MHTIPLFNGQDSFCGFPPNRSPPLDHPPPPTELNLTMLPILLLLLYKSSATFVPTTIVVSLFAQESPSPSLSYRAS
ncbi:unnamed protein product [Microthlaspi erraticum]|uniref:Uncharacterized protein n=1 Tax=Microthlaspi erraticum TaxID=1685480 RepID=A0A6D2JPI4_9BRAS|nr:unnamed protein product [Microthlaspi erraticum]